MKTIFQWVLSILFPVSIEDFNMKKYGNEPPKMLDSTQLALWNQRNKTTGGHYDR